jgi:hypothetical protein
MSKSEASIEKLDERLRRVEILVATLVATQTAMLAVGSFLAVALFNNMTGG